MKTPVMAFLLVMSVACTAFTDSIFDAKGTGRDIVAAVGATRALGGAVGARTEPLLASIMNPFASAMAEKTTVTAGFAHTATATNNFGEEKRTITTLFPSIAVTVPLRNISILTGLFLEKEGRLSLAEPDTAYGSAIYDVSYRKESSIHSVPVFFSATLGQQLVVSTGIIVSFFDTRERTVTDFRSNEYSDAEDISDTFAMGESFAVGFLLDLDRMRIAGLFRGRADMDGTLERENRHAGIWSSQDITISSQESFKLGLFLRPIQQISVEVDYDRSPWSKLKLGGRPLTDGRGERWSVGIQYRGDRIWRASKYPLNAGYYRQPLDWETKLTGKIVEEVFSVGTLIPISKDRAAIAFSLEVGRRQAEASSDIDETIYGFSVSISAIEAWRREIRR